MGACWPQAAVTGSRFGTSLFPEIAKEFIRYLQDRRSDHADDPPFLLELAHYEWVELALSIDERELEDVDADPAGDLLEGRPVLSPLAWALSYRFPVHRIGAAYRPDEAPNEPTHLLVYRDRADEIHFMRLNDVTRLLIDLLGDEADSDGRSLLRRVADTIRHPEPERVVDFGAAVLQDLFERGILLGTRVNKAAP